MEDGVIYGNQNDPSPPENNNQNNKEDIISRAQNQPTVPTQNIPNQSPQTVPNNPQPHGPQGSEQSSNMPTPPPSKSKLKKIIFIAIGFVIILFLILISVFTIFSGSSEDGEVSSNEDVELTYWGMWEDASIPNSIISDFEAEYPNIKVIYQFQPQSEYKEKLIARYNNGKSPDIFRFHVNWQEDLIDILLPLTTDVITREEFEANYYEVAVRDLIRDGAIYGIPLEIDTLALYVNPSIIKQVEEENEIDIELPADWQEFIEVTQVLTKRDEFGKMIIGGVGMGSYDNVNSSPDTISLLLAQNRVDLDNLTNSQVRTAGAFEFYTNFVLIENNTWVQNMDLDLEAFADNKLAMYFGYSRDYHVIKKTNPSLNFQIIPVPQLTSNKQFTIANYLAEGVSNSSLYQKEAMIFMNYLTRPQVQEKIFQEESKTNSFGAPFSNKNLANKLQGTDAFIFVNQANNALSSPFAINPVPDSKDDGLNSILRTAINSILTGTSPEKAADTFIQSATQGPTTQIPNGEDIGEGIGDIIDGNLLPQ